MSDWPERQNDIDIRHATEQGILCVLKLESSQEVPDQSAAGPSAH